MQPFPLSLSITRQTIQDIWQVACRTNHGDVLGLLGMGEDGLICRAQHLEDFEADRVSKVMDTWSKQAVFVVGHFQTKALDMGLIEAVKQQAGNEDWFALQLNVDTEGCLKSNLYRLKKNEYVALPITLVENGQPPLKG